MAQAYHTEHVWFGARLDEHYRPVVVEIVTEGKWSCCASEKEWQFTCRVPSLGLSGVTESVSWYVDGQVDDDRRLEVMEAVAKLVEERLGA